MRGWFQLVAFIMFFAAIGVFVWPSISGGPSSTRTEIGIYLFSTSIIFTLWVIEEKIDEINKKIKV